MKIKTIRIPGYEADDIIGTLAHQAAEKGFQTWMVTPDKDYDQLVNPTFEMRWFDKEKVCANNDN